MAFGVSRGVWVIHLWCNIWFDVFVEWMAGACDLCWNWMFYDILSISFLFFRQIWGSLVFVISVDKYFCPSKQIVNDNGKYFYIFIYLSYMNICLHQRRYRTYEMKGRDWTATNASWCGLPLATIFYMMQYFYFYWLILDAVYVGNHCQIILMTFFLTWQRGILNNFF